MEIHGVGRYQRLPADGIGAEPVSLLLFNVAYNAAGANLVSDGVSNWFLEVIWRRIPLPSTMSPLTTQISWPVLLRFSD
ncbi:MAG: hypothetical protein M5U34_24940 [Chloroflexi bacterium]|nr:hypothetical protein [Chloroflexota bacterium]